MRKRMVRMTKVYIGLGGNMGDTYTLFCQAINLMQQTIKMSQLNLSRLYQTSPVGNPDQDPFLNAVCSCRDPPHPQRII